jgi:hypothetical protein
VRSDRIAPRAEQLALHASSHRAGTLPECSSRPPYKH